MVLVPFLSHVQGKKEKNPANMSNYETNPVGALQVKKRGNTRPNLWMCSRCK